MYSFSPLADLNQVHAGLYAYLTLAGVLALVLVVKALLRRERETFVATLGYLVMLILFGLIVGFFSYSESPIPRNEKVIATFVGTTAESETRSSGKSSTKTDHYLYATFKTPDGMVVLRIEPGVAIPERVILYKN